MTRIVFAVFMALALFACRQQEKSRTYYPSQVYHYVTIDTAALGIKKSMYVPVYSHMYLRSGQHAYNLTATLSVRNTSYTDSFFLTHITYYGSQGEVIKHYLDSTLLLKPMASYEFVVEDTESRGGAGANFVVQWGASRAASMPLVQAVMTGTNTGISFVVNGVEMK